MPSLPSSLLSLAASISVCRRSSVVVVVVRSGLEVLQSNPHVYREYTRSPPATIALVPCFLPPSPSPQNPVPVTPMESRNNTVSPQPGAVTSQSSGGNIKRSHTITAATRTTRPGSRLINNEQDPWKGNGDEAVDPEWVGGLDGLGAVGEKSSSLHRQTSLPTRHLQRRKSLLFLHKHTDLPFPDDPADHFDSLWNPAKWNPTYA